MTVRSRDRHLVTFGANEDPQFENAWSWVTRSVTITSLAIYRCRLLPSSSLFGMRKHKVTFDENAIDAIFRTIDQSHLPGVAVGIAISGIPVYRKGFGLANIESPVTLTAQTRMRIYSITKHFTCMAYMLLCEEGKAGVNDPLVKYLPELHPIANLVTMKHLMSNTSGLRDACDIRWFFSGMERTVSASSVLSLYGEFKDVNFVPGRAWCYNNGGYQLLGSVIEKLADRPLEDVFQKRLFEPSGMHDSLLRRVDTDFVPNSATMHLLGSDKKYKKKFLPGELTGEGGIVSTVDDMLRWMRNMADPAVGRSDTWALMSTPQKLNDGAETGYGMGLFRRLYRGTDVVSHSGGALGSNSQMIRVPEANLDVVVLGNRSDVSSLELAARILDVCLGKDPIPVESHSKGLTGLFRSPTTGQIVRLNGREERQTVAIDGGEQIQMVLTGNREFRSPPSAGFPFAITWEGDAAAPEHVRYEFFGTNEELSAIPSGRAPGLGAIAGDYRAETIGVRIAIAQDAEGGYLITKGQFGSREYRLEGLAPSMWEIKSRDDTEWSGVLTAGPSGDLLVLRTSRTWQVRFRRAL